MKPRSISKTFLEDLLRGSLVPIVREVRQDETLDLELRGESIIVYYRGAKILEVVEFAQSKYKFNEGDPKYLISEIVPDLSKIIDGTNPKKSIQEYLSSFKFNVDLYFGGLRNEEERKKRFSIENEIRQHIIRENNYTQYASETDYFIIDSEYTTSNDDKTSKFDIVAIEWIAESSKRSLKSHYKPKLAIFELKYAGKALKGDSGLKSHYDDYENFIKDKNEVELFKKDILKVLKQKRQLGLIPYLLSENSNEVLEVEESIDFIYIIANYNHRSSILSNEIKNIPGFKMITANYMGYGLYKRNIQTHEKSLQLSE